MHGRATPEGRPGPPSLNPQVLPNKPTASAHSDLREIILDTYYSRAPLWGLGRHIQESR